MEYINKIYEQGKLPKDVSADINWLIQNALKKKIDKFWKNYENLHFWNHDWISVQYSHGGQIHMFSTIFRRDFYPLNTFRLLNRLLKNDELRKKCIAKTNFDKHPSQEMLNQQIETLESEFKDSFYFISRQEPLGNRWFTYYVKHFNYTYNSNLTISKRRHWVCDNYKSPYNCCQWIIYPKDRKIPLEPLS